VRHRANLLHAQLVGGAVHHRAAVRVTAGHVGRRWPDVFRDEDIDLQTIEP